MSRSRHLRRKGIVVLVAGLLLLSLVPGIASAQTGVGGTIVVEEGETVSEVSAVGGSIIIHGTVTGDVSGAAGNVLITGTVEGDVSVATGNLQISGHVEGDVSVGAGNVHLEEGGTVNGLFEVGAGEVRIDGTINNDAQIGAETIRLGDNAIIAGSLTYDGNLVGNEDAVAGEITRDRTIGPTAVTGLQPLASWVFSIYAFIANLLLGAVLLGLFPRFSDRVAARVRDEPLKSGVVGIGVLIAIPLFLLLLILTIIGIPLALVAMLLVVPFAWIGLVYGRFALGMWVLSYVDREQIGGVDRRWVGLLLGLVLGGILAAIPFIGGLINIVIFLLGFGALALGLNAHRKRGWGTST